MKTKIAFLMLLLTMGFLKANAKLKIDSAKVTNSTSSCTCNGSITVYASGGTGRYTYYGYNASNGATIPFSTNTASGLCAGSYYVFVQDTIGDSTANLYTVTGTAPLSATDSTTNTTCGTNNGTACIYVRGGATPYTYSWSIGATTPCISGLSAGKYSITVTDKNGCTLKDSVNIINGGLNLTLSYTFRLCYGSSNGFAKVTNVSSGASPYIYSWSTGATTDSISGLLAGLYSVTVTDKNGCMGSAYLTITQDSALYVSTSAVGAACGNSNGSAVVKTSGGWGPYRYSWTPTGGTGSAATGLSAGTYTVTVTDTIGCSTNTSVTIPATGLILSFINVNDSCYGANNGSACVNGTGGTSPYMYSWSTGATTPCISGLSAGSFSVTVTDKNGCSGTSTDNITQPTMLTLVIDTIADTGKCSGRATIYVKGGTYPFTYTWVPSVSHIDSGSMSYADTVCYGVYYVKVTDAHGCTTGDSIHIRHSKRVTGIADISLIKGDIKLYPIPNNGQFTLSLSNIHDGNATIEITNILEETVYKATIPVNNSKITQDINMQNTPNGLYFVRVITAGNVYISRTVISNR